MKIAVMAAGAVGGYFGGRLAASGSEVYFIARGRNLEALRRDGLRIESPLGDLHLTEVQAHEDPATIGPVDVVLFAVKLWHGEAAATTCRPLIGPDTAVITLQNGIGSAARITPVIGADHAVGGAAYIASVLAEPGVIHHGSQFARLVFGETDGGESLRLTAFQSACGAAGIDTTLSADIERDQWEKFVFLVGLSGITGLTREAIGASLEDPDRRVFFHDLMKEVVAVGRAAGVALDPAFADDRLDFAETTIPATMRASLLDDLERGNRLELDWLAGEVVRRGRDLGVPTPANAAVYVGLKPFAEGGAGENAP
jgi:2-dehydropantoate 2-reductase